MDDSITSAKKGAEAFEKERIQKEKDKNLQSQIISSLKKQNDLLEKEYRDSQIELEKSKKLNLLGFIFSLIFGISTIVLTIIQILK